MSIFQDQCVRTQNWRKDSVLPKQREKILMCMIKSFYGILNELLTQGKGTRKTKRLNKRQELGPHDYLPIYLYEAIKVSMGQISPKSQVCTCRYGLCNLAHLSQLWYWLFRMHSITATWFVMCAGRVSGKASPSDLSLERYMAHANSAKRRRPDFVTFDNALVAHNLETSIHIFGRPYGTLTYAILVHAVR